jgi:uncharacterized protein YggE
MRIALAAAFAVLLVAAAPAAGQTTDTTPTVAADGVGTATLTPDLADFQAGVSRRAATSRAARKAVNTRIAAILRVLGNAGVADADIRTVGLSIVRERVRRKHRPTVTRYLAEQALQVRERNVARLGALLDAVADAGADAVGDPDFGFADPSAGRLLATRAALADARRRADDAAAQQGLRITGVRSIDLDPSSDDGAGFEKASGGSGANAPASTHVSPGTQEFSEHVRVVYTAA